MLSSNIPPRFPIPFANAAGASYVRAIPTASQIGTNDGAASLTDGFPPDTFLDVAAGGLPPDGRDFNGILRRLSQWAQWQAAGVPAIFDSTFATAISGYPKGALLQSTTFGGYWLNTVESNVTDPDGGGASGWAPVAVQTATAAEVRTGTAASKVVTPKSLGDLPHLYQRTGYQVLPGGLIAQWGIIEVPAGGSTIIQPFTFPIAFPTQLFVVTGSSDRGAQPGSVNTITVVFSNVSESGATAIIDSTDSTVPITTTLQIKYVAFGF